MTYYIRTLTMVFYSPSGQSSQLMFPLSSGFKQFAVIADNSIRLLPGHNAFNVLYPSFVLMSGTPSFLGTVIMKML